MKYRLWDMSWMEAEEAFRKSDTVIVPVGTLHGHGPTPISIDCSSVERLAEEVARKTGLVTLPLLPYGENEKMKHYPGSIAINPVILEGIYTDICRSLHRNGIRRIVFLNGHGGNREALIKTGYNVRKLGMVIAILEWYLIGRTCPALKDLFQGPRPSFLAELAVSIAIGGRNIADIGKGGYKGEWGPTESTELVLRKIFGNEIVPLGRGTSGPCTFDYKGGEITIPVDAWDIDLENPPEVDEKTLDVLRQRGEEIIKRLADYMAEFTREFAKVDVTEILQPGTIRCPLSRRTN